MGTLPKRVTISTC